MSWKTVALGDVIELQNGYAFKSSEYSNDGYFLMRITNVQQGYIQNNNPKYVNIPNKSKLQQFILNEGDILMSLTGDVGRVGVLKEENLPAALNQRVARIIIKPSSNLDKKYLFNFLNSDATRGKVESLGHGAAQLNVSTKDILSIEIPLPPLATQQKIVAKLDSIFAEIDKATAVAEANAKNTEALFQSYLRKVFAADNFWIETNLGNNFELYQPQTITTKDLIEDGKYQVYGANGVIGRYDKYNHEEPQLLVTCRGATCGAVNVSSAFSWINGNAMVVKPKSKNIDIRFTEYFFRGAVDLSKAITGAAQPQITRQSLSPIKFSYPPIATQHKIVEKLDAASEEINKSAKSYKHKVSELFLLKQSILKQAFAGELVKE